MNLSEKSPIIEFLKSVSHGDPCFSNDIDTLLLEADFARDDPPSFLWLRPFARLIAACHARVPEWELLTDRIRNFAVRVPELIVAARCEPGCLSALNELVVGLLDGFPLFVRNEQSLYGTRLPPWALEQDELLFVALDCERRLPESANAGNEIHLTLKKWMSRRTSEKWSASFVVSLINYTLSTICRSPLYDEIEFQRFANDVTIRTMHFEKGRQELEQVFSTMEMKELHELLC